MTRGTLRCCRCGRTGHVSATCPDQPRRTLVQRLRAWWRALSDPLDVEADTEWQESKPKEPWVIKSDRSPRDERRLDADPTAPGGLDTLPGGLL